MEGSSSAASSPRTATRTDHKRKVVNEIVSSEGVYVEGLRTLNNRFVSPLLLKSFAICSLPAVAAFLADVETLLNLHEKLWQELVERLKSYQEFDGKIGDIFVNYSGVFKLYGQYARNYEVAMPLLLKCSDNEMRTFLVESEEALGQTFPSLTITPIQRIPRYLLLLRELSVLEKDDPNLTTAIQLVEKAASHVNDAIKQREALEELLALEKQFVSRRRFKIAVPGRKMIRHGPLSKISQSLSPDKVYIFHLFSDLLTYSEETALGLKMHRAISLRDIDVSKLTAIPSKFKDRHTIRFENFEKPFYVYSKREEDRDAWVRAIEVAYQKLEVTEAEKKNFRSCTLCNSTFEEENRIKVCSLCNAEVCDMCSQGRKFIPQLDKTRPVLLCDLCMEDEDTHTLITESEDVLAATLRKRMRKTRATKMQLKVEKGMTTADMLDELVRNERTYVQTLEILLDAFIRPLLETSTVRKSKVAALVTGDLAIFFTNIEQLTTLNKEFANTLEMRSNSVCEVFKQYAPLFKVYAQYGKFLEKAKRLIRTKQELTDYFKQAEEDSRAQGQDLFSLLEYPLARLKNYDKFLLEYGESLPDDSLEWNAYKESLEEVQRCNHIIQEAIEETKVLHELEELQTQFAEEINLTSVARRLIRDGLLTKFSRKGETRRYMFHLFTDMMLYSKPTNKGFEIHQRIKTRDISVKDIPDSSQVVNAWIIQSSTKSFLVYADTPGEKERWLMAFHQVVQSLAPPMISLDQTTRSPLLKSSRSLGESKSSTQSPKSWWDPKEEIVINTFKEAPVLQFAKSVERCKLCDNEFNWRLVRRHCKMCGEVVCQSCSTKRILIPKVDANKKQRICDKCFETVIKQGSAEDALKVSTGQSEEDEVDWSLTDSKSQTHNSTSRPKMLTKSSSKKALNED